MAPVTRAQVNRARLTSANLASAKSAPRRLASRFPWYRLAPELQEMILEETLTTMIAPAYDMTEGDFENNRQSFLLGGIKDLSMTPSYEAFKVSFGEDLAMMIAVFPQNQLHRPIKQAADFVTTENARIKDCYHKAWKASCRQKSLAEFKTYMAGVSSREAWGTEQLNTKLLLCQQRLSDELQLLDTRKQIVEHLEAPDRTPHTLKRKGDLLLVNEGGHVQIFKRVKVTDWIASGKASVQGVEDAK